MKYLITFSRPFSLPSEKGLWVYKSLYQSVFQVLKERSGTHFTSDNTAYFIEKKTSTPRKRVKNFIKAGC